MRGHTKIKSFFAIFAQDRGKLACHMPSAVAFEVKNIFKTVSGNIPVIGNTGQDFAVFAYPYQAFKAVRDDDASLRVGGNLRVEAPWFAFNWKDKSGITPILYRTCGEG